jgi:hypothetical protein
LKTILAFLRAIPELVKVLREIHESVEGILRILDQHLSRSLDLIQDVVALKGRLAEWEAETEALLHRAEEQFLKARRKENSVKALARNAGVDVDDDDGPSEAPPYREERPMPPVPGNGVGRDSEASGEAESPQLSLDDRARLIVFGGGG